MRIAVNARLLLAHRMEGVARYIFETTRRIVHKHPEHEFHLYFDRPYDERFVYGSNVVPHVLYPPARHPILWKIWFDIQLKRAMDRDGIDVLFSGESFISLTSKIPVLMVSHDIYYHHYPSHYKWSHRKYYQHYFPKYHRTADHIIAVSDFTKQDIIDAYGLNPDKISVAGNAAPEGFRAFSAEEKQETRNKYTGGHPYLIYVGSLHPRKNVARLIEAYDLFRQSSEKRILLVIYGRKAFMTADIDKAYHASPCREDIVFIQNEEADLKAMLASAVAMCYISLFEGFGIPILEAFHCEIPVITSSVSSMPEVAGDAALLVDPHSQNEISQAMLAVTEDEELRMSLVTRGNIRKQEFDWERSAGIIYNQLSTLGPGG